MLHLYPDEEYRAEHCKDRLELSYKEENEVSPEIVLIIFFLCDADRVNDLCMQFLKWST